MYTTIILLYVRLSCKIRKSMEDMQKRKYMRHNITHHNPSQELFSIFLNHIPNTCEFIHESNLYSKGFDRDVCYCYIQQLGRYFFFSQSEIMVKRNATRSFSVREEPGVADNVPHRVHHQVAPGGRENWTIRLVKISLGHQLDFTLGEMTVSQLGVREAQKRTSGLFNLVPLLQSKISLSGNISPYKEKARVAKVGSLAYFQHFRMRKATCLVQTPTTSNDMDITTATTAAQQVDILFRDLS